MYKRQGFDYQGIAELHIAGASEPSGYSKRIQYDTLLRTTTETDLTGKSVKTEWDSVKDLQLSKTDAIGMKSTTIYDCLLYTSFRVSTNPDAESGAVINSGWISSPQWTIPDGVLQDLSLIHI